jgi:glutamate-ammonia-ligase adenylyltransferase
MVGQSDSNRDNAIERAMAHAPFLRLLASRREAMVDAFRSAGLGALDNAGSVDPADVQRSLRLRRGDVALVSALADLSGDADFGTVVRILSDFADEACDAALTAAFAERVPDEEPHGLAVIALGKLGSHELNYSSDIDPILVFDPETLPRRARDDPEEAAVRIARRWVDLLSQRTAEGHVLRVDLRLRPSPEVTPIVLPVDAAISYYETHALAWEQAAFIRARASAGDKALGRRFLGAIQPFIWRRSLDFGQIRRIGEITDRIRSHYASGQAFGPGYDLKRGRGGIREVEFFAQVQQLIHGGRNAALRAPATLDALAALSQAGIIEPQVAGALGDAYRLLRTIEHRLQMVEDQQTHSLPGTDEALANVARLHGLACGETLVGLLSPHVATVGAHFDALVGDRGAGQGRRWPHDAGALAEAAVKAGFADGPATVRFVERWRGGAVRALRTPVAQEALEELLPTLMPAIAQAPDPAVALARFDALLSGLPSALNFMNLLVAQPQLAAMLAAILAHAPALADDLAARPTLIEGLLDASVFAAPASPVALAAQMGADGRDYERHLDHVRNVVGEHRFALGVQLVAAARDPLLVSRGYADIADAALEALTAATIAEFESAHGRVPGAELLILALGRLGGRALTHASDLDLILLYDGDHLAESDGPRPLGATTYFNRLGQRVIAALSVPTAAGRLYDIDVRLRPQGNQGPLVASLDAFTRYQREEAWTWEHMALTRARPVFGSKEARGRLSAVIADVLSTPRDPAMLRADIAKMRADMATHKPPASDLDVKLVDGGLVDCEFAIHATQLVHRAGFDPRLNVALRQLVEAGLAPAAVRGAMDLMGRMLVTLRLMAPDGTPPSAESAARVAQVCGFSDGEGAGDWPALLAAYADARQEVGGWWRAIRDSA